jgi:hypothetical protein
MIKRQAIEALDKNMCYIMGRPSYPLVGRLLCSGDISNKYPLLYARGQGLR